MPSLPLRANRSRRPNPLTSDLRNAAFDFDRRLTENDASPSTEASRMFTSEGRTEFERLVDRERAALRSLVAEHEHLSAAIAAKRACIKWAEGLTESPGSHSDDRRHGANRPERPKKSSRIERARLCLQDAGESLHVGDILTRIGEEDSDPNRNSLSSQIHKYIKEGRVFVKDETNGPRHFGLRASERLGNPPAIETAESGPGGMK